jgi:excisionase family DNA binding protein
MNDIELLTIEEVAGLLKVEPRTIYRYIDENKIPGVFRISLDGQTGSIRFVKAEILKWIQEQIATPAK